MKGPSEHSSDGRTMARLSSQHRMIGSSLLVAKHYHLLLILPAWSSSCLMRSLTPHKVLAMSYLNPEAKPDADLIAHGAPLNPDQYNVIPLLPIVAILKQALGGIALLAVMILTASKSLPQPRSQAYLSTATGLGRSCVGHLLVLNSGVMPWPWPLHQWSCKDIQARGNVLILWPASPQHRSSSHARAALPDAKNGGSVRPSCACRGQACQE